MSRLVLQMQTSIDGFVSSTVPGSRWQLWDWGPEWTWSSDLRDFFNDAFAHAAGILLSPIMLREGNLAHWATMGETHGGEHDWAFARRVGDLPIFVPSRAPRELPTHPHVQPLSGPLEMSVAAALQAVEGDVLCFGGAGLASSLLDAGLVDEIQLFTNPGFAGEGERIFSPALVERRLWPDEARAFECGVVVTRWRQA